MRQEARVHSPVAFVPLRPTPLARRSLLGVLASGLLWLLAGCRHVPSGQPPQAPQNPTPPSGIPAVKITTPQGVLRVAPGSPETVAAWEHFTLEAVLLPEEAQVLGEPRVTASGGEIKRVQAEPGSRMLRIEYRPGGGSRRLDPNETVSVAWTVRGPEGDTVILTRAFVHVNEDGSYSFGYETPRPTIAEMAAPPIYRGPKPGS